MSCIQAVQQHVERIVTFLEPLLPLANCHMVDFFTKNVFKNYLTSEIQEEIDSLSHSELIENIFESKFINTPNLENYFRTCKECMPVGSAICINLNEFYRKLKALGFKNIGGLKLDIFMSPKKSHEVEILSSVVASLREASNTSHVVDIGDGKGYLSSMLALHHKIPVLGIDASSGNSNAAVKRVRKLEKIWHSVYENPTKSVPKQTDKKFTSTDELYKQITKFVDSDINFNEIASNVFDEKMERISLAGLHTCGNLAATSIKIYNENSTVKTLSNVGCCYHLLDEKFETDFKENVFGFPLSNYMINKKFCIGRNARMVAAQSVNRIFDKKELPDKSIFYRALLQVVLERKCDILPMKNVGKMRKKYDNFVEYAKLAMKRLELDIEILDISDSYLENLYNEFEKRLNELNIFYLIRCMTSPVIESLILLDRLLFLLEQGHKQSFLVQLFDPVVSPRCYGIISLKC